MGRMQQISWERTSRNWNITHTDTVVLQYRLRSLFLPSFLLLPQSVVSNSGAHTPGKDLCMSHVPRLYREISSPEITVAGINTDRSPWRGCGGFAGGDRGREPWGGCSHGSNGGWSDLSIKDQRVKPHVTCPNSLLLPPSLKIIHRQHMDKHVYVLIIFDMYTMKSEVHIILGCHT